jgi:hemoglobin
MTRSLYDRLGGVDKIAEIVSETLELHLKNPAVSPRFRHAIARLAAAHSGDEAAARAKLKRVTVEFFSAGSGGPHAYTGRPMRDTHAGMNISEQEFVAVVDDIVAAMEKVGVGPEEKNEVVAILFSLKGDIIRI